MAENDEKDKSTTENTAGEATPQLSPRLSRWITTFRKNLRTLRKSMELSQKDFAKQSGLKFHVAINRYEGGQSLPKVDVYLRMAELLGKNPGELFETPFPYKKISRLNVIHPVNDCSPIVVHETYIDTIKWTDAPPYGLEVKVCNQTPKNYSNILGEGHVTFERGLVERGYNDKDYHHALLIPPPKGIEFILDQLEPLDAGDPDYLGQLVGKPVTAYYQMSDEGEQKMKIIGLHWRSCF